MIKALILSLTLVSSLAFADDFTVIGACTYSADSAAGAVSICEQAAVSPAVPADRIPAATEAMQQGCAQANGAFVAAQTCTMTNALGGCRGTSNEGAVKETIVVYQNGALTADQVKSECEAKGMEFFLP